MTLELKELGDNEFAVLLSVTLEEVNEDLSDGDSRKPCSFLRRPQSSAGMAVRVNN